MDFVQSLDPSKLVQIGTGISFALTLTSSPSYNLPIFLLGVYVQDSTEATLSLQTFTGLLGASAVFDLIWIFTNEQRWFARLLTVALFFLKLPSFLAFFNLFRQRGGQISGLGPSLGGGATVWSMPGGFTSNGRDGYQTVDEEPFIRNVRSLSSQPNVQPPNEQPAAPGAYQTV